MKTRITGLVQLKTGDAVRGVVSRLSWPWRYVRIDTAEAFSAIDPTGAPVKVDGVVWIPKTNIAYVQEVSDAPVVRIEAPQPKQLVTTLTPGGRPDEDEG